MNDDIMEYIMQRLYTKNDIDSIRILQQTCRCMHQYTNTHFVISFCDKRHDLRIPVGRPRVVLTQQHILLIFESEFGMVSYDFFFIVVNNNTIQLQSLFLIMREDTKQITTTRYVQETIEDSEMNMFIVGNIPRCLQTSMQTNKLLINKCCYSTMKHDLDRFGEKKRLKPLKIQEFTSN